MGFKEADKKDLLDNTIEHEKLPLGVEPYETWEYKVVKERQKELKQAILRYLEASKEVPIEWLEEYNKGVTIKY